MIIFKKVKFKKRIKYKNMKILNKMIKVKTKYQIN